MSEQCREIRIVTGPGGRVQGSKVYLDGQELKELSYVEIKGAIGSNWELGITQVLKSPSGTPTNAVDRYLDMGEGNV